MHRRSLELFCVIYAAAIPFAATSARAADAAKPAAPAVHNPDAPETWGRIQADYQAGLQQFNAIYASAKTDAQRRQVINEHYPDPVPFARRALALAQRVPGGPHAIDELAFTLRLTQSFNPDSRAVRAQAIALIRRSEMNSPALPRVFPFVRAPFSKASDDLLRDAAEHSPLRTVRAQATLALARDLDELRSVAWAFHDDPSLRRQLARQWGQEYLDEIPSDPKKLAARVQSLYQRVIDQYGDVSGPSGSFKEVAAHALYALDHLSIGQVAPDIRGTDIAGKPMRLADYRGKVVVLDFWRDW